MRFHLLLDPLLVPNLKALIDELGEHNHSLGVQKKDVLHVFSVLNVLIKRDELFSLYNLAIPRCLTAKSKLHLQLDFLFIFLSDEIAITLSLLGLFILLILEL